MPRYCQTCAHTIIKPANAYVRRCADCIKEAAREYGRRWRAKNIKKKVKVIIMKPLARKRICQECGAEIDTARAVKYCRPCGITVRERLATAYRAKHKVELAKKAKVKYKNYKEWRARKLARLEEK